MKHELERTFARRARACRALASWIAVCTGLLVPAFATEHPTETDADRKPRLVTTGTCVIRNATIHTAVRPPFTGDVLVQNGDIAAVGSVTAPAGALEIDATGKHLAPGVVDCHSHIAIDGNVNEASVSISAEVSIQDVIDAEDLNIYRALAGGVTTARLLHGSANAIGGQDAVIKLKWKRSADELRFPGAQQGIKFALGENPKRSNWGSRGERFPGSRMGVEAVFPRAFSRAREYATTWTEYEARRARGEDVDPPRRDLRLDALAGILRGDVHVHSHCYRADEILMLLEASRAYGFQVATLQHVLEGYKVAKEMADANVGGSTFGDWWGYKIEAYDAVPQNAALMEEAGVLSSLNSDSAEMMRRLYGEAAKSVRYARMDRVRALALVTLNPAKQLGIEQRVGSIEVGKDADLVLLSADPLSAYARVAWTMVDGEVEFEQRDAFGLESDPPVVSELAPREAAVFASGTGSEVVAIVGATLHPITSPAIENGVLLMSRGRIVALGRELAIPAGARTFDAHGRHVYPGMIALDTNVGLLEIGAIAATDDQGEIGGNQPDVRVAASINADSAHIGVTRASGITRAQTSPQSGGPIRGQSAVVRLAGDTWQEMVTLDRDMLHVRFPRIDNDVKELEESAEQKELVRLFEDAREYGRVLALAAQAPVDAGAKPAFDPRLEALAPFARGEKTVALHADNAQTILSALKFAKEQKLRSVLYGAREAWKVVDALQREGVSVVVGPILELPSSPFDPYDAAFANAAVLARAKVPFAICAADAENTRNLPFHAAMACAFGLPHAEALRAVTLYPARILGVEAELGSLEVGKLADVVVTDGDLLEIATHVEAVFIDGVQASLENRQTELYERYRVRLQRLLGRSTSTSSSAAAPAPVSR